MGPRIRAMALTALAITACEGAPPMEECRCSGDVPGGRLDIVCGTSLCVGGNGYRCTGPNTAVEDRSVCPQPDAGTMRYACLADDGATCTDFVSGWREDEARSNCNLLVSTFGADVFCPSGQIAHCNVRFGGGIAVINWYPPTTMESAEANCSAFGGDFVVDSAPLPGCAIRQGTWRFAWTRTLSSSRTDCVDTSEELFLSSLDQAVGIANPCPATCGCSDSRAALPDCLASRATSCSDGSANSLAVGKADDDLVGALLRVTFTDGSVCEYNGLGEFLRL